jgi:hypothetical protein
VDGEVVKLICDFGKTEYFFGWDWTDRNSLIRLEKLDFARESKLGLRLLLIRPCNSEIYYRWLVPKGMACRGLQSAAGRWRSDRIPP